MGFRLVPKSVTSNDLGCMAIICIILPNSAAFGAHYIKVMINVIKFAQWTCCALHGSGASCVRYHGLGGN